MSADPPSIAEAMRDALDAPAKVLAVDDQRDSLKLLEMRLRAAGMESHTVNSGEEALKWLETQLVDVIILDVMMPGLDGFETCQKLKSNPRTREIPVLFLTARLEQADMVRGLEIGAHDYLNKPVQQEELIARTRAAVRIKRIQDKLRGELVLKEQINQLHQDLLGHHWENTFGQLAASLAHELNNPLAAALGSIQLLGLDEDLSPTVKDRLELVDNSLQRVGKKLRSLLLIAHSHNQKQLINLSKLIEDLITVTNYQMVMNKVRLTTDLDPSCEWEGVASEIARALLYVINNAIEAVSECDRAQIHIRVDEAKDHYSVLIEDNGHGIAPDVLPKIFDPFFTTKPTSHQGLGLHLAKEIIEEAGGTITLISNPNIPKTTCKIAFPKLDPSSSEFEED